MINLGNLYSSLLVCSAVTVLVFSAGGVSSPVFAQSSSSGTNSAPAVVTPETNALPTVTAAAPADYRLDTDDTIAIEVSRANGNRFEDVSRSVRIPADGMLRLGRGTSAVSVRGKTLEELQADILRELTTNGKLNLKPNQVTVSVAAMRQRRVYVSGTAVNNGEFDLKNGWRVSELVAVMGGVKEPQRVTARIVNPRRPSPVAVNLDAALNTQSSADNVALVEGDTLMLDNPKTNILYVKGEGPRGEYKVDNRMGLRQALVQVGFNTNGATGSLRDAVLVRHEVPGDPSSPQTRTKVDLFDLMLNPESAEIALRDRDTLEIPVSTRYIYVFGELGGNRKWFLPEDRKTYLADVMANAGGTTGRAQIGSIKVYRQVAGVQSVKEYDFGKFLGKGDMKQNPEILPQDMVIVPATKKVDVVNSIWTGWGLFNIVQSLIPGMRLR